MTDSHASDMYSSQTSTHVDRRVSKKQSYTQAFSSDQQVTVLRQTVITTRTQLISEISHVDGDYIDCMSAETFLEYIEHERLAHMPRRGSKWDKVLKWAEFFAIQISGYENALSSFVPDSDAAAKLILAACRILVELGPNNAAALETTFSVFYKIGLSISFLLQRKGLLSTNSAIRTEVGQVYNSLVILVRDISLYYRTRIGTSQTSQVNLNFNGVFGKSIEAFYSRKDHVIEILWESKLHDASIFYHVQQWLAIPDSVTRRVIRDEVADNARRDEYTCEWFQRPLLDFSRSKDDVLAITGPAGTGKSYLAQWIIERLQRPLGKKTHATISLTIDREIPSLCTTLAILKRLVGQLLEVNIGDIDLLDELEHAHKLASRSNDLAALESHLWKALSTGLKNANADDLMLVIDGLDDRCGKAAIDVSNKLAEIVSHREHVQVIILSRDLGHLKSKTKHFAITSDHTHHDLQHVVEHVFSGYAHYDDQTDHQKESIAESVAHAAKGNFLWAQLTAFALKQETSHDAFTKAVKGLKESPKSLDVLTRKLVTTVTSDFTDVESKRLLTWLLVAERPLLLEELESLSRIDPIKKSFFSRKTSISEDVEKHLGVLVRVQNGIVRFRHDFIRDHLVRFQIEGKKLQPIKSAQAEFVFQLLALCSSHLDNSVQPTLKCIENHELENTFRKDALLSYSTRYWIIHFKRSALYKETGHFEISDVFKAAFPSSAQLALLEWFCWGSQYTTAEAVSWHKLSLRLREQIFTEKHVTVIQTLVTCAELSKRLAITSEAGTFFYRASRISRSTLSSHNTFTVSCTEAFLEITKSITITTRTELVTHREDSLVYIISAYEHHHGKNSDTVIKYTTILAELYVSIKEVQKAETIWQRLREIMVIRYGKGSAEETGISGHLDIVLKKGETHVDLGEYEKDIFETTSELEVWDVRRITITLKLAKTYESQKEFLKAEEIYVTLWGRLIDHCHHVHLHHVDIDVHISMIDIALDYVGFLRRCHRHEEAASVLICIWNEYEEFDFESETIFIRLKTIGQLMRAVSLLTIAVSVFKKCLSWFTSHGKYEHAESCQTILTETIEEVTTTTTTVSTTTTTTTETIIKETFNQTISKSVVTSETVSVCKSLISYYMKCENWSEAVVVSRRSLELIWRMVVSEKGTIALPREFSAEAIEIAIHLATCHRRLQHYHEAETIYLRIYTACFNSCSVEDVRLTRIYTTLVEFYTEHKRWDRVIKIHQEYLIALRKHLGGSHKLTIKTLYILGDLCQEHGHGHAHEYYEEIITVLKGSTTVCHVDAFRAMKIMCRIYFEEGNWKQLKHTCDTLWELFLHHHKTHVFEDSFVKLLYMRYIYVLEKHSHAGYEVIRTITIQYRETCVKVFGILSAMSIYALIELASVCMRSEKHIHEAVTHYEEVIKTVTTTTTTTTTIKTETITTVKERLAKAYVHVCTHGTATAVTIERAILILTERFEHLQVTLGCCHVSTLAVFHELLHIHWRCQTKESHAKVVLLLQDFTVKIISKEKHSRHLFDAAKSLGRLYVEFGLHDEGHKILRELHLHISSHVHSSKSIFTSYASEKGFITYYVSFKAILEGEEGSYSKSMSDLLIEITLYESYSVTIKKSKDTETILIAGARLHEFLHIHSHKEQVLVIEEELYKVFTKKWGAVFKTQSTMKRTFFICLLSHLSSHQHINHVAWISASQKVQTLMAVGQYKEAHELAVCAFEFIEHQKAFHDMKSVPYGFVLSASLAGHGLKKSLETSVNAELYSKMLALSRKIIGAVFHACKDAGINFVRMKLGELNKLVSLLGEQENYADLEWLLTALWSSREVQKSWSSSTIISLGKLVVQARFLSGQHDKAISLCETICYNVRRVWGALDPKALEMAELLSRIYTGCGHHREAMRVHEEVLRLVLDGDDDDDRTIDTVEADRAAKHVQWLRQSFLRLGGWDKSASTYVELVNGVLAMPAYKGNKFFEGIATAEKWNAKDKAEEGKFVAPRKWILVNEDQLSEKGEFLVHHEAHKSPSMKRMSSSLRSLVY